MVSQFTLAAEYAAEQAQDCREMLVLDLEHGQASVCTKSSDQWQVAAQTVMNSLWSTEEAQLFKACRRTNSKRIARLFKTYLQTGANFTISELTGIPTPCRAFVEQYRTGGERKLMALLEQAQKLVEYHDSFRILLYGTAAAFYPVEHTIRCAFSKQPFLSDKRFLQPVMLEELAEYQQVHTPSEIVLCLLDERRETHRLTVSSNSFTTPFYAAGQDTIRLELDGTEKQIAVPQEFTGAVILQAGIQQDTLILREYQTQKSIAVPLVGQH